MKLSFFHIPLTLSYPGGAPGFTNVLEDLSPTFMSPHSVTLKKRDKYGPAHHHISFGYNKFTGEVVFVNSDNDPKTFKGLILRLTGAEFGEIPDGFKGFYSNSNYLTHANRVGNQNAMKEQMIFLFQ